MSADAASPVKVKVAGSIAVFVTLLCLTFLNVGVSYLRLSHALALTLAAGIALVQAALFAAVFMHVRRERPLVHAILGFTALSCLLLLFLPHWTSPGGLISRY